MREKQRDSALQAHWQAQTTASTVNFSNAKDVAAQAFTASETLNAQSDAAGNVGESVATGVSIHTGRSGLIGTTLQQLYRGLDAQAAGNLATGVVTTNNCTNGGTISYSSTIAGTQAANGDSVSILASNCVEGDVKLNGEITYTFNNVQGTIGSNSQWSATLSIVYSNLTTEMSGDVLRVHGDLTLGYSQTSSIVASALVSGSSLQFTLTSNGATIVDYKLSNFSYSSSLNSNVVTYSANYTLSGKLGSLGNTSYTVKTNTAFKSTGGAFPSEGSIKVTATDNTSLTLTAIDSINVKIELDTNGDGATDQMINTTWSDLASRA